MSPEKQRIAIAEACGWRYAGPPDAKEHAVACWYAPGDMEWHQRLLPDYLNDLNAMHEAEKVLPNNRWSIYRKNLIKVTGAGLIMPTGGTGIMYQARLCIHATAAQRAEAFLKALNLWEDEP